MAGAAGEAGGPADEPAGSLLGGIARCSVELIFAGTFLISLLAVMVRLTGNSWKRSPRSELWRLWMLIIPLGLAMLAMARLRDPQTAGRVNRLFAQTEAAPWRAKQGEPLPARDVFQGIRRKLLATVHDNTYFRNAEQAAWFHFFEVLQQAPGENFAPARSLNVDYTQLVDQPDFYRGKLVTARGFVREVTEQKPAENEMGLTTYYRVIVQPTDGINWPIIVYCLKLPSGLREGSDLAGNMSVTGLFFKNLSYRWQNGLGTAPVIVAKTIEHYGPMPGMPSQQPLLGPNAESFGTGEDSDASDEDSRSLASSSQERQSFRDVLELAGWSVEWLAALDDGKAFSDEQRRLVVKLLRRLRSFDSAVLAEWAHDGLSAYDVLTKPDDHRGQLVRVEGRVEGVERIELDRDDAARLEMPEYFEVTFLPNGNGWKNSLVILTARVPSAWLREGPLREPASATALYLKRLGNDELPASMWLAKEVAWHPTAANPPLVSLGESVLGAHGMDVGLLDGVAPRGPILAAEREAFYQMLNAASRVSPWGLIQLAQENLPAVRKAWRRELAAATTPAQKLLAKEVSERAADGRYSVAPLFNVPASQIGNLIVVDGTVRRAVRVEVGSRAGGGAASGIERRFGIDHYYELDVFTEDSQNYPLVFCVRELPGGFPVGGSIHAPVRIAGFFFKDWLYRTRGAAEEKSGVALHAPLLVGRSPLLLKMEAGRGTAVQIALGGLFVATLAGIVAFAVWSAREDRRFRARTPAAGYSLSSGESLDGLNVAVEEEPKKE